MKMDIFKLRFLKPVCNDVRFYTTCIKTAPKSSHCRLNSNKKPSKKSPYYFEDGLRKAYPFYFNHTVFCKAKWFNKTVLDVYSQEFSLFPKEECESRIIKGLVRVNHQKVSPNYILKHRDIMTAVIHQHELPVLACPIEVLLEDDRFLVINKPPSIPVHACGFYHYNTVLSILQNEYDKRDLYVIHRLDRLASGLLLLAKSKDEAKEWHFQHNTNENGVVKEYVCRVHGNFPDGVVICDKPIKMFYDTIGISLVHSEGKTAVTEFKKLHYNGKSSVVLCKPHTGRTHQIRVHLHYLGHHIMNDPVYNNYVFGCITATNGKTEKPISELLEDFAGDQATEWHFEKLPRDKHSPVKKDYLNYTIFKEHYRNEELTNYVKDESKIEYDTNCHICNGNKNLELHTLGMFLHACKYETESWSFKAPMPFWASEDWTIA